MDKMSLIENGYLKKGLPDVSIGDQVEVHMKIQEEGKTRIQVFEGLVIAKRGRGVQSSFTVRRISYGEGAERVFPVHSPFIDKIVVVKKGIIRRAKLYYLRKKIGKKGKVKERIENPAETPPEPRAETAA